MRILSQNKCCIFNAKDTASILLEKNNETKKYEIYGKSSCTCFLAVYASKQKADVVMDMLFNCKVDKFIMPQAHEVIIDDA